MTNKLCKEENAERRRDNRIERLAAALEFPERFVIHCQAMYTKHSQLRKRRPAMQTAAAALIVSKRECGYFESVARVSEALALGELGSHVMAVSKIVGVDHRSKVEQMLPDFVASLGFPFKYSKRVLRLYKVAGRLNGCMASSTVAALVLWRFFQANAEQSTRRDKITLEFVASLVGSAPATLRAYMEPGRCTMYPDEKDFREAVVPSALEEMGFFSHAFTKRTLTLFDKYAAENPHVDRWVVLGLVLWRIYKANKGKAMVTEGRDPPTLRTAADMVWTSPATLKSLKSAVFHKMPGSQPPTKKRKTITSS
jgi:hypothetical protein